MCVCMYACLHVYIYIYIAYHVISYHVITYDIISCHTIPCIITIYIYKYIYITKYIYTYGKYSINGNNVFLHKMRTGFTDLAASPKMSVRVCFEG